MAPPSPPHSSLQQQRHRCSLKRTSLMRNCATVARHRRPNPLHRCLVVNFLAPVRDWCCRTDGRTDRIKRIGTECNQGDMRQHADRISCSTSAAAAAATARWANHSIEARALQPNLLEPESPRFRLASLWRVVALSSAGSSTVSAAAAGFSAANVLLVNSTGAKRTNDERRSVCLFASCSLAWRATSTSEQQQQRRRQQLCE